MDILGQIYFFYERYTLIHSLDLASTACFTEVDTVHLTPRVAKLLKTPQIPQAL